MNRNLTGRSCAIATGPPGYPVLLLVGLGLYGLIQYLPSVIIGLFELFRNKVSFDPLKGDGPDKANLALESLRAVISALFIYGAPFLTNLIDKKLPAPDDSGS